MRIESEGVVILEAEIVENKATEKIKQLEIKMREL